VTNPVVFVFFYINPLRQTIADKNGAPTRGRASSRMVIVPSDLHSIAEVDEVADVECPVDSEPRKLAWFDEM
jgi:hypothetical protein